MIQSNPVSHVTEEGRMSIASLRSDQWMGWSDQVNVPAPATNKPQLGGTTHS
jgi:hypothetical protein